MPEFRDKNKARAEAIKQRYKAFVDTDLEIPQHLQDLYDSLGGPVEPVETAAPLEDAAEELPNSTWTVAELKAYAYENKIDLGTATKKADILAAIEAAA